MDNLQELGIQELTCNAMKKEFNGGGIAALAVLVGTYLAVEIAGNPKAHVEAFKKGWNAG